MADDANTPQTGVTVEQVQMNSRLILKILALVLAVAAALWIIYRLRIVILLLVFSVFFSYFIAPLVERLERSVVIRGRSRKLPRGVTIAIVYLALALVIGIIIYSLLPSLTEQISALVSHLPQYANKAKSYIDKIDLLHRKYRIPPDWQKAISSVMIQISGSVFQWIQSALLQMIYLLAFLPWLILVPILAFFMLKDAKLFRKAVVSAFPTRRLRRRIDELFSDASYTLAAYVRTLLTACVFIGVVSTIGFKLLGSPYPLVLGVIAGILEFIPLAGPLVAGIIAVSVTAAVSFKIAFYVLIFILVLRLLEDYVIYPRLAGHAIEMHPLAIIVAVLSGAELGGVVGIFLAIPVVALITVVYRNWLEYKGSRGIVAEMLKPPEPSPQPTPEQKQTQTPQGPPPKVPAETTS